MLIPLELNPTCLVSNNVDGRPLPHNPRDDQHPVLDQAFVDHHRRFIQHRYPLSPGPMCRLDRLCVEGRTRGERPASARRLQLEVGQRGHGGRKTSRHQQHHRGDQTEDTEKGRRVGALSSGDEPVGYDRSGLPDEGLGGRGG
jgi:hypothetical protein